MKKLCFHAPGFEEQFQYWWGSSSTEGVIYIGGPGVHQNQSPEMLGNTSNFNDHCEVAYIF